MGYWSRKMRVTHFRFLKTSLKDDLWRFCVVFSVRLEIAEKLSKRFLREISVRLLE